MEVEERVVDVGTRWLYLPIVVDHAGCVLSQFNSTLMGLVRPTWSADRVKLTVFEDGTTNKLVRLHQEGGPLEDAVLLRLNGVGTDLFIDRDVEITVMISLNRAGIVAPVYSQVPYTYS